MVSSKVQQILTSQRLKIYFGTPIRSGISWLQTGFGAIPSKAQSNEKYGKKNHYITQKQNFEPIQEQKPAALTGIRTKISTFPSFLTSCSKTAVSSSSVAVGFTAKICRSAFFFTEVLYLFWNRLTRRNELVSLPLKALWFRASDTKTFYTRSILGTSLFHWEIKDRFFMCKTFRTRIY